MVDFVGKIIAHQDGKDAMECIAYGVEKGERYSPTDDA